MKFCPLTQKDCRDDCQLYINGKCSITVIANEEYNIFNTIDEIANHTANLAATIIDKKGTL